MYETTHNRFTGLAHGVSLPITIIIDEGNGELHRGMCSNNQENGSPYKMRPGGDERKERDCDHMKQYRTRVHQQEKTQHYVLEMPRLNFFHRIDSSLRSDQAPCALSSFFSPIGFSWCFYDSYFTTSLHLSTEISTSSQYTCRAG